MKTLMTVVVACAVAMAATGPASAESMPNHALTPGQSHQTDQTADIDLMVQYLGQDGFVPSRLELRQLSSDVVADLIDIAIGRYSAKVRSRAIQSLALYRADDRARQTLTNLLDKFRPGDSLFPAALVAYGQMNGEQGVARIKRYARHGSDDVRMAAVVALGRFGGAKGYEVLSDIADSEHQPVVRDRINSYLN